MTSNHPDHHNFRMMGDTLVELADRNDPNTTYTKLFTIHDKEGFMRFYNHVRQEYAELAFKSGWDAAK